MHRTPPSTDTNYEDAGLFILTNYATQAGGAENSATRSVAINNGTGAIWAQANEVRDLTNTNNPTAEQAGIEMANADGGVADRGAVRVDQGARDEGRRQRIVRDDDRRLLSGMKGTR